ncbi:NAD(+) diphosphatase [Aureimonas jatrophae]|uniref:NAD(+) diphosphatase n=1 Tax=Aureimonas jatrophae TaxID=1166073 RepID=A0A1H0LVF5_9HYPH|nr:NAD(+) diphosphatase [Aureimonas jatrophae]MBB3952767.1 NAD+ diphosphatase [Aureimonas jatrophae]SDO72182.1 NAD+ diphosphatase [Aureimonas jatrophae]
MRLGYSGNRLVRDGEHRDADQVEAAARNERARIMLRDGDGAWQLRDGDPLFRLGEAEAGERVLLGHTREGAPRWAGELAGPAPAGAAPEPLRRIGSAQLLDENGEGQLAQASHLLNWHAANRFCGRCGSATASEAGGFRRRCTACGHILFPRTDPVTIMLVHDGRGRCLLGRQPQFPAGMWSCLAGFVEAGETVEDAVRRETLEEAGITVGEVRYLLSQPWPFPGSLMLGCAGLALDSEIRRDETELEDCRWFRRDEVRAMLAGTHADGIQAPQEFAIAHHLIRRFAADPASFDTSEEPVESWEG